METKTLILIIGAAIIALGVAVFQYFYKNRTPGRKNIILAALRFLSVFCFLLLLINPGIKKQNYYLEYPALALLVDNSGSIKHLKADSISRLLTDEIRNDDELNNRFDLNFYSFGNALKLNGQVAFDEKRTNLSQPLQTLSGVYKSKETAVILLTDGNQTFGEDYEYIGRGLEKPVFPLVLGDTTAVTDLRINALNVNRYTFLKNKFPVEIFVKYEGTRNINTRLSIRSRGKTLYTQPLKLSNSKNSVTFTAYLEASEIGVKAMTAYVEPLENEKNKINNAKQFAIEVVDEKLKVGIVSNLVHPDLGALKKSIESNEQREVQIFKPDTPVQTLEDFQLLIFYQPDSRFRKIYNWFKNTGKNSFTITGKHTDWNFLNGVQSAFSKNAFSQTEEVQPLLNENFAVFTVDNFDSANYPPINSRMGEVNFNNQTEVLLYKRIRQVDTQNPLLITSQNESKKEAVLFGEGLWKWRMHAYTHNKEFTQFDDLIGKILLYLSSNRRKRRLTLDYEAFYYGNGNTRIKAKYFDNSFVFDPEASLSIRVKNRNNTATIEVPMLLKNNYYETDLSNLEPGQYGFTVKVKGRNIARSGGFTILDFDVERQFLNANKSKLEKLALQSQGRLYYSDQLPQLKEQLLTSNRFKPIRKSSKETFFLINWHLLLGLLLLFLASEWFLRKYYGLI